MIRNPVKCGVLEVSASGVKFLPLEIGHRGTYSTFLFRCRNGEAAATDAAAAAAILGISILMTQNGPDGSFATLDRATPRFLNFREQYFYGALGITNAGGIISFDPAAGVGKDELRRDQLTYGTLDLTSMQIKAEYNSVVTGVTHIEVWADIDYNLRQNLGEHVRIGRLTDVVASSGGEVEMTEFSVLNGGFGYNAIHIEELINDGDDLTVEEVSLVINGQNRAYMDVPSDIRNRLLKVNYRDPQTGWATIDFNKEDMAQYFLPGGMNELKVIPKFKATGTPTGGNFSAWYEHIRKAS